MGDPGGGGGVWNFNDTSKGEDFLSRTPHLSKRLPIFI